MTPPLTDTGKRFLALLRERVLVFDGATGTSFQAMDLGPEDFGGAEYEGCNEHLVVSKPSAVESVHRGFLEAGCDVIETDTFGGTSIVLAEFGLGARAYELNRTAAGIARRTADAYSSPAKPRFVAGSVGPTTKLPSLGHIGFTDMRDSFRTQIDGLLDGGADLLCIETCQDMLQAKCALAAARAAFDTRGVRVPVVVSVTIESTGAMLLGTDIGAAIAAIEPYDIVSVFGVNCATGPREMEESVRAACEGTAKPVFVMPNAGMPENVGGRTCYRLEPDTLGEWMERYVAEFGVNLIGGCCGTTPAHVKRLAALAARIAPKPRVAAATPAAASLYAAAPLHLDPPPVLIGERCNANGSRRFRDLLLADDYDGMVAMAKEQADEGAHLLDVCVAYVGRDEARDMAEVVFRFNTQATLPLVIDTTEPRVLETALRRIAGRAIVNSINLEDGEERAGRVLDLCRTYGAAVIALTIDEDGMAKTAERKLMVARRIRAFARDRFGLRDEDLIFDPLTFTLGSGDEEFRASAMETVEAIRRIKREFPRCHTSLGVSNVSFGLAPRARHVLNSVFLHHACEAGLDMAIVHASRIMPLYAIDAHGRELAADLMHDRRRWETLADA